MTRIRNVGAVRLYSDGLLIQTDNGTVGVLSPLSSDDESLFDLDEDTTGMLYPLSSDEEASSVSDSGSAPDSDDALMREL